MSEEFDISEWRLRIAAVYIPLLSGWLSITGSSSIIYSIWAHRESKLSDPQHRILFAMSSFDIFYSLCKALTFALYPSDLGIPAFGNLATCSLQGFFTQFGYAVGMYNLVLSTYYYLTIVKRMKQRDFSKCIEKCCHTFIITATLVFSSTGSAIGLFNPTPALCYIAPYPPGCTADSSCTRFGDTYPIFYEVFAQMWIQIAYVVVTFTNVGIWWYVRKQGKAMLKYSVTSTQYQVKNQQTEQARQVFIQSMLYVGAFVITWSPTTIFHLISWITGKQQLWPILLINLLLPLQGFLNAFIYARPRFQRIKAKRGNKKLTFCQTLKLVFLPEAEMTRKDFSSSNNATLDAEPDETRTGDIDNGDERSTPVDVEIVDARDADMEQSVEESIELESSNLASNDAVSWWDASIRPRNL